MHEANDQLALSAGLTAKTNALCLGLESGAAEVLDLVTPSTAELLKWWFGDDMVAARGGLNFHAGQKQAILNAIVAHEVPGATTLLDLYKQAAPDALLAGNRISEVAQAKHAHPKYCLKMATGTGKTWVLQALLIWQMPNKNAAISCSWPAVLARPDATTPARHSAAIFRGCFRGNTRLHPCHRAC